MKKKIFYLIKVAFVIITGLIFLGCGTSRTRRYNTFVPMQESSMLTANRSKISEFGGGISGIYQFINNEYVYVGIESPSEGEQVILPSGKYLITGRNIKSFEAGTRTVIIEDRYGGSVRREEIVWMQTIAKFCGLFDFEPGYWYDFSFDFAITAVYPTETAGTYADEKGNLYPSSICTIYISTSIDPIGKDHIADPRNTYFVFTLESQKIDDKNLGQVYVAHEYTYVGDVGIRYPNMLGASGGWSRGVSFFFDPINIRAYYDWRIGFGFGVLNYDFPNIKHYFMGAIPSIHGGINVDFDINKLTLGLGGGGMATMVLSEYTFDAATKNPMYTDMPALFYFTPYLQMRINNFLYIDYYFGKTPWYNAFGIGLKGRM